MTGKARVVAYIGRAMREPLVHFAIIGAVLFGAYRVIHGPPPPSAGDSIVISEGRVKQLAESYLLLAGRLPSREEMLGIMDDFVTEEIDYREAVALGLDADDTIVRRRMRQKLEFLVEDASATDEPTEADLTKWLADHAADYKLPERRSLRQVLISSDRKEGARPAAEAVLAKLKTGADPSKLGDPSMLPSASPLSTEQGLAGVFGPEFAHAVFAHEGTGWFGPVASAYGQHAVLIVDREQGRSPALAEVRDRVRADWIETRRGKARDDHQARMRKRYSVRINWPEAYKGLPQSPSEHPKTKPSTFGVSE